MTTRAARQARGDRPAPPVARPVATAPGGTYERLHEVGRLLLSSVDLQDVLRGIAAGLCHFAGCSRSVLVDFDPETGRMRGLAGHGVPEGLIGHIDTFVHETPLVQAVLDSGQPVFVHEPSGDNSVPDRYIEMFGVGGTLGVAPLNSEALGLLGMAFVDRDGERFLFEPDEREAFEAFCALGSLAMQNAILVERSQQLAAMLERSRIAAELHDGVTQLLFSVGIRLEEVLEASDLPEDAVEQLTTVRGEVEQGAQQLRRALFELSRPSGATSDTLGVLREVLDDFTRRTGIVADLQTSGGGTDVDGARRRLVVRTVTEALRNVEKHAGATEVLIRVRRGNTWWMVDVDDDGDGHPRAIRRELSRATERFGLYSLAQEAEHLQGRLWVVRAPRLGGVCLSLSLPVADSEVAR